MKHNSGKILRTLAVLAALLCLVLAGSALAEAKVEKTDNVSGFGSMTSEEAAEQFIYQQLGWTRMLKPISTLSKGSTVGDSLGEIPQMIYDDLEEKIQDTAAGNRASTEFDCR